jgi:hypothetical protein
MVMLAVSIMRPDRRVVPTETRRFVSTKRRGGITFAQAVDAHNVGSMGALWAFKLKH